MWKHTFAAFTTAIEVINVDIDEEAISINTSMFKGWSPPFVSVILPLGSLRVLPLNNTFSIIVDVARNLSNILPTNQM